MIPPTDASALAAALLRVLHDADLRQSMRERGLVQAQQFAWHTTAERTLQVYTAVAQNTPLRAARGAVRYGIIQGI